MADILERVFYGVWLPKRGWLKVQRETGVIDCYSDMNRDVVVDTAARFHGEVRYVDGSLYRLEEKILEQEAEDERVASLAMLAKEAALIGRKERTPWHTFKTWSASLFRR